jgi:hypothetical protein
MRYLQGFDTSWYRISSVWQEDNPMKAPYGAWLING